MIGTLAIALGQGKNMPEPEARRGLKIIVGFTFKRLIYTWLRTYFSNGILLVHLRKLFFIY